MNRPINSRYRDVQAYETKDRSLIRELMHPSEHGNANQSLAEATVAPGRETLMHRHARSEELYHITEGVGLMTLGGEQFEVAIGDTVCISPGTAHCIRNTGAGPLKILCCCSPPYAHDDTEMLI